MTVNVLMDKAQEPTDELIKQNLGPAWPLFDELRRQTAACEQDWRHYGKKYGWKLKVHADGKTLLELTVADGWLMVAMAIRAQERQDLVASPIRALAELASSGSAAAEGYGIRMEIRDRASCEQAKALVSFVMDKRKLTGSSRR